MTKTLLWRQDLQVRALAEIRKQPGARTFRVSRSIASRISTLTVIGPYVCCPRALLMQTPRLALHSMSKAFCAAITI
jgi:hypothetical protein